jgi:hypothetical protein
MGWGSGSGKGYCSKHGKKLKNGQCPKWGCKAKAVAEAQLSGDKGTRRKDGSSRSSNLDAKGRNVNGIRYDDNGRRIWGDD